MSNATPDHAGSIVSLWRYPIKSMRGEELDTVGLTERGLFGDRIYAMVNSADGKLVSAKNPRKWPGLFDFRAALSEPASDEPKVAAVQITLPDGTTVASGQRDVNEILSGALGREVTLESMPPETPSLEEYWPDIENLDHRDTVTNEPIPPGAFFDGAPIHLLTTATIDALRKAYPQGRFEVCRFRPNIVVQPAAGQDGFVENSWIGRTLALGDEVRLKIDRPCPRCVMTTLAQGDLPQDSGILRTAVQQNQAHVGVYASVVQGGTIRRSDAVRIVE